ncbi:MAG: [ribosomal protein S5]-alanine N-acetyltransferase [Acidobacteriota bacterium]|jgi:ribosomal-protein-alanine N-acetyltransferase|nr:[ribosomal protein S5]-alanine N-acetyltransferase [Acidobacteriota bacterium]
MRFNAGEEVFLRAPAARDAEEFVALNRASRRLHHGFASPPIEPEQFAAFLKRCRKENSDCFFVCRVEDGRIVGTMNLTQIVRGDFRSAYLGYYVGEPYAGRGYMTEALRLLLRHAFGHLKLHRIEANIQPSNVASLALVKRAGFVKEGYSPRYLKICGRWRDHERWAILADDWPAARKRRSHI